MPECDDLGIDDPVPIIVPNPTAGDVCIYIGDLFLADPVFQNGTPVDLSNVDAVPLQDLDASYTSMDMYIMSNYAVQKVIQTNESLRCTNVGDLQDGLYHLVTFKGNKSYSTNFVIQKN